jgi:hypothetical protein
MKSNNTMDTSELELLLTRDEFFIFCQSVNRRIKSLGKLTGGLSVEERKRMVRHEYEMCLELIKRERRLKGGR